MINCKIRHRGHLAFTLAEVLLVLIILGTISSYTIPTLIQNVENSSSKIAWKKSFSDINQASLKIMQDNGGTLRGAFSNTDDIKDKYAQYLINIKSCDSPAYSNCWHPNSGFYYMDGSAASWVPIAGLILSSGRLLMTGITSSDCQTIAYGVKRCAAMWVDVNGWKGPNTIGKDIYGVHIMEDRVVPYGVQGDNYPPATDCKSTGEGRGCSALYLRQ